MEQTRSGNILFSIPHRTGMSPHSYRIGVEEVYTKPEGAVETTILYNSSTRNIYKTVHEHSQHQKYANVCILNYIYYKSLYC